MKSTPRDLEGLEAQILNSYQQKTSRPDIQDARESALPSTAYKPKSDNSQNIQPSVKFNDMMSSIITPVEELAEEPPVASEDDSLMSLGLGLGIKVPMHLTKKG